MVKQLTTVNALVTGILAISAPIFFVNGCATDKYYEAGKVIYIAGKRVVVANWDSLPPSIQEKLKKLDEAATRYDAARGVIKPAIEAAIKGPNE